MKPKRDELPPRSIHLDELLRLIEAAHFERERKKPRPEPPPDTLN